MRSATLRLPPRSTLLAATSQNYLLDFKKHHVLIGDNIGICSPGSPLPLDNEESLRRLLATFGVEYVLVDVIPRNVKRPPPVHPVDRDYFNRATKFYEAMDRLAGQSSEVFRDERLLVVRLSREPADVPNLGVPRP